MTREDIRLIVEQVTDTPCPNDGDEVPMTSLQQLEFVFAIEDGLEFRHPIPADISWKCVNDVVKWLAERGELQDGGSRS